MEAAPGVSAGAGVLAEQRTRREPVIGTPAGMPRALTHRGGSHLGHPGWPPGFDVPPMSPAPCSLNARSGGGKRRGGEGG